MQFSLFYFADESRAGTSGQYDLLLEGARFADRHGLCAVWTPERHFDPFGGLYPNPAVTAAAVAAVTSRVAVRAGSVVAPLHDPLRIAEEWSVVDNLSNGRAGVSFASGWHPVDFVLSPDAYPARSELLPATIETIRQLWRGGTVARRDGKGRDREVRIYPAPLQPDIPIWLTTTGRPETFRLAAGLGAGVLTHLVRQEPDALAANIAEYRRAGGRHVTLMVHTYLGQDRDQVRAEAHDPMCSYLESSLDLISQASSRLDRHNLPPQALASRLSALRELAFGRYFDTRGLFGTVPDGVRAARRFAALGVDELACLIDFGLPRAQVLRGLEYIALVRDAFERAGPAADAPAPAGQGQGAVAR